MTEQEAEDATWTSSKWRLLPPIVAISLSLLLPVLAKQGLRERVSVDLAMAASRSLRLPITLGEASVGLTGTLEIADIRIGDFLKADRIIASIGPSAGSNSGLAPNEILVQNPSMTLRVAANGSSSLNKLIAQRRKANPEVLANPKTYSHSEIRMIRFTGGVLDVYLADLGRATSKDISLWMRGPKVHVVFGNTEFSLKRGSSSIHGSIPRAALDYKRGDGLQRFLANGGAFTLSDSRGRAQVRELTLAAGIGDKGLELSAKTGIERATGSIRASASIKGDGLSLRATMSDVPLALLASILPENIIPRTTLISGRLQALTSRDQKLPAKLSVEDLYIRDLRVLQPALSQREIRTNLHMDATTTLEVSEQGFLAHATLASINMGHLQLTGKAMAQWPNLGYGMHALPDLARISMQLAPVACDAALDSLPPALKPSLAGLELRGTMSSHIDLMLSRISAADTHLSVASGIENCKAVGEPAAADTLALRGPYEYMSPDGRTRILAPGDPNFVAYAALPPFVPRSFAAAEDARFFSHSGFDTHQIERSLAIDMQNGRLLRGGSTISQQVIKNLFLHRRRSLARKLQEAILTWRLEANVTKKRIMEIYLNIIELGPEHTYGLTEASQRWFGISPTKLSILQTAFLAALTPEPTSMSARIHLEGGLDAVSSGRVETILRAMRRSKAITLEQFRSVHIGELKLLNP